MGKNMDKLNKMKIFVKVLMTGKINFFLDCMDAKDLMVKLKNESVKFDRIDVSNISDENYIGLKNCLQLSAPILKKTNPYAKLLTTLMNWVSGTEYAYIVGMNA